MIRVKIEPSINKCVIEPSVNTVKVELISIKEVIGFLSPYQVYDLLLEVE